MGIKRRLWFLVLGMLLCSLLAGCGKEGIGSKGAEGKAERVQVSRKQEITPTITDTLETTVEPTEAPPTTTPLAEVLPTSPSPTQMPPTAIPMMEAIIEPSVPTVAPMVTPMVTSVPTESPLAVTPTYAPVSQATEKPVETKEPVLTKAPEGAEAPTATRAPQKHSHGIITETKEATCLTAGIIRRYCSDCGEVEDEKNIPALGHDFVKSVWELPTCMKGGYYNNVCNRCGLVECVTQEALPHDVEDVLIQEGNCMQDTVIQHICKSCGQKVKSDTRYTPYEVHSWTTAIVDDMEITFCNWCGVAR